MTLDRTNESSQGDSGARPPPCPRCGVTLLAPATPAGSYLCLGCSMRYPQSRLAGTEPLAAPRGRREPGPEGPHIPERLGKYEVIAELGRGGMGIVVVARDPRLEREVAMKIMQRTDPDEQKRFLDEAKIAAKLDHPHIVKIYDFGELDDMYAFTPLGGSAPQTHWSRLRAPVVIG